MARLPRKYAATKHQSMTVSRMAQEQLGARPTCKSSSEPLRGSYAAVRYESNIFDFSRLDDRAGSPAQQEGGARFPQRAKVHPRFRGRFGTNARKRRGLSTMI